MADCKLDSGESVLVHTPSLELGGLCVPGARLLLTRAGKHSKLCAYALQLVALPSSESCWVGANPALGNRLAAAALALGLLDASLGAGAVRAEVSLPGSKSRIDFELSHGEGRRTLVEVKSVVCADWAAGSILPQPPPKGYAHVLSTAEGYERQALFPIGRKMQKLDDGRGVVSERAIRHVQELAALRGQDTEAAVLFVVNRGDCASLSLRRGCCPVFPEEVAAAARRGLRVLACRVRWEADGCAHWEGFIPCDVQ